MQWISSHVSFDSVYWNINRMNVQEENLCKCSSRKWLSIPNWKQFAVASQDKKKGIQVRSQGIVLEETLNMTDSSLLSKFHKHCYRFSPGDWKWASLIQYTSLELSESHHVVRIQNFNPVAIRILNKCKSFHFTYWGEKKVKLRLHDWFLMSNMITLKNIFPFFLLHEN